MDEDLEATEFINTQNRRQRRSLNINESDYDLADISYQSLPNSSTNKVDMVSTDTINKLSIELQIANTEIDNLNVENSNLKEELEKCKLKINLYKSVGAGELKNNGKITGTPIKFYSPYYRVRHKSSCIKRGLPSTSFRQLTAVTSYPIHHNTSLNNLPLITNNNLSFTFDQSITFPKNNNQHYLHRQSSQISLVESRRSSQDSIEGRSCIDLGTIVDAETEIKSTHMVQDNKNYGSSNYTALTSCNKHRVVIYSDQTGFGLRRLLQYVLGESFDVTSTIKPDAPLSEIVRTCITCKDFSRSDYIIIMGGSQDNNPLHVQSSLYWFLSQMQHTNVLVCKVYNSKYLNVNKLNDLFRLICNNFENSEYLPLDPFINSRTRIKYCNKLLASRLILKEILRLKYKYDYLDYVTMCKEKQNAYNSDYNCFKKTSLIDKSVQTDHIVNKTDSRHIGTQTDIESDSTLSCTNNFFRDEQNQQ